MDFIEVLKGRRSAVKFDPEFEMSERDFNNLFKLTNQSPSVYNLQSTKYIIVTDEALKERMHELSYNQFKVKTATAIILVYGNKDSISVENAKEIYDPSKNLGVIDVDEYDTLLNQIDNFSKQLHSDDTEMEKELIRNACTSVGILTLSAQYLGFNTCVMHIQQAGEVKNLLEIPDHDVPILMIAIGKSISDNRPRGYRKGFDDFVSFNKANSKW